MATAATPPLKYILVAEDDRFYAHIYQAKLGIEGFEAIEYFNATICTRNWPFTTVNPLESHIFISKWDYQRLLKDLAYQISKCEGKSWDEVMQKVGKIAQRGY